MTTAISAHNVVKTFGATRALDGLDLAVETGEVHGFLGPNGAGKSTTMKMITGFLSPTAGSVRVCGHDLESAPLAAKSYVCPGVVAIPLDARTDAEITLLANLITLTPGSVTLDLSEDRRVLYIHAMYIDGGDVEAYRRAVKDGLERRVLELLR